MTMSPYHQVKEFHDTFAAPGATKPTAFSLREALFRAEFKLEEIVEFLYATSENNSTTFETAITELKNSIDKAVAKIEGKAKPVENVLTEQVDALVDTLYLTYGSFVLMGVDPTAIFNVVHQANMAKLFPDGKPHYDPITHKILKPDNWEKEHAPEKKIEALLTEQTMLDTIPPK